MEKIWNYILETYITRILTKCQKLIQSGAASTKPTGNITVRGPKTHVFCQSCFHTLLQIILPLKLLQFGIKNILFFIFFSIKHFRDWGTERELKSYGTKKLTMCTVQDCVTHTCARTYINIYISIYWYNISGVGGEANGISYTMPVLKPGKGGKNFPSPLLMIFGRRNTNIINLT